MSHPEAARLLNSEAIVECVASTSEPSAFPVNTPITSIPIALRMGPWSQSRFIASEAVGTGACCGKARSGSSRGSRYQGINWLPEEELSRLDIVRELSLDDDSTDHVRGRKPRREVRSVGWRRPWAVFRVLIVRLLAMVFFALVGRSEWDVDPKGGLWEGTINDVCILVFDSSESTPS